MIADLLQKSEQGEDVDIGNIVACLPQLRKQIAATAVDHLPVELHLYVGQAAVADILDFPGQFIQ